MTRPRTAAELLLNERRAGFDPVERSALLSHIAMNLGSVGLILKAVRSARGCANGGEHRNAGAAPATPEEHLVANIWRDLLGLEQPDVMAEFFSVGGDSFLAVRLISRVSRACGKSVALHEFLAAPTIRRLAALLSPLITDSAAVARPTENFADVDSISSRAVAPLSVNQERLFVAWLRDGADTTYNTVESLRIEGDLNLQTLRRCLTQIAARHEVLRSIITLRDGRMVQEIQSHARIPFLLIEQSLGVAISETQAMATLERIAAEPFDLEKVPPLRVAVFRLSERVHVIAVCVHHIVADGWSIGIFLDELMHLYRDYSAGGNSSLAPMEWQYADFCRMQSKSLENETPTELREYWREHLNGADIDLQLPSDHRRLAPQPATPGQERFELPVEQVATLQSYCASASTTPFAGLLAAFKVVMRRRSGQGDLTVATNFGYRDDARFENNIGFFVNLLPLRSILIDSETFREVVGRVAQTVARARLHHRLPFHLILQEARWKASPLGVSPVRVLFSLQRVPPVQTMLGNLRITRIPCSVRPTPFDLDVLAEQDSQGITLVADYNQELWRPSTIRGLLEEISAVLTDGLANPELTLSQTLQRIEGRERDSKWRRLPSSSAAAARQQSFRLAGGRR